MKDIRIPVLAAVGFLLAGLTGHANPAADSPSPETALATLLAGNNRFVSGEVTHPDQGADRRIAQAGGQTPFAVVLTCSDSRVAPELYFDQGIGSLFVIRNAGNVLDDHVIGSIEYAVEHLHVGLIVVVGHTKCGAVAATVAGGPAPGRIRSIVESIQPALASARDQPGDKIENVVRANARRGAGILAQVGPFIAEGVKAGKVIVVAARYDLTTGTVELLH